MELVFVGVDFSTVRQATKGKTVVAHGVGQEGGLALMGLSFPSSDEALASLLREPFTRCGIDAPLSLPPCVLCRDLKCGCPYERWMGLLSQPSGVSYHYRLADILIRMVVPGVAPKPPLSNGGPVDITPLTLRWQRLARHLIGEGDDQPLQRIVEVYATGAIQLYAQAAGLTERGSPYRYRGDRGRREALLFFLAETGRLTIPDVLWDQLVEAEDAFDAAFAALVAWHAHFGAVLLPEEVLGLNSFKRDDLVALPFIAEDEKIAMSDCLRASPWMMLPDVGGL